AGSLGNLVLIWRVTPPHFTLLVVCARREYRVTKGGARSPANNRGSSTGEPAVIRNGNSPAHTGIDMSTSSSFGGPTRTFAETSTNGSASTEVPLNSCSVGSRTSSQRPGTTCSVNALSAVIFSSAASTIVAAPRITTER